tara:strand:+ start:4053 stop:4187 length:135 start_codon:yes stop_codon:yes gene_type:complete
MGRSVKSYWVKFKVKDYKENPNLLIDLLTDLRIEEIENNVRDNS